MNRLYFFLIIISISLNVKAQKNFEGLIKFSTQISTTNLAPLDFKKDLEEKYGDSLVMYYSMGGNFKRIHKNSAKFGMDSQLYLAKKGVLYLTDKNHNVDSLNVKINTLQLTSERKISSQTIMGLDCDCYEYEATSMYQQHVVLTYCYSKKTPRIDDNLYAKHIDFFLSDFYKMSKRPYLKFSIQTEVFTITYIAHELIKQHLNQELFQLK